MLSKKDYVTNQLIAIIYTSKKSTVKLKKV